MTREEAIRIIRETYHTDEEMNALESLIPELRESEDERIRKAVVSLVYEMKGTYQSFAKVELDKMVAWLEKQKEQKPNIEICPHSIKSKSYLEIGYPIEQKPAKKQDYSGLNDLERAIHRGFLSAGVENVSITIIKETARECLAQMNPAEWNDTDMKEARNNLISVCRDWECGKQTTLLPLTAVRARYFLEHLTEPKPAECIEDSVKFEEGFKTGRESGLRDGQKYVLDNAESYGLCKPAEWSEEDERRIDAICELLENTSAIHPNYSHRKLLIWLKSLRPSWKPSEEQMNCLCAAVDAAIRKHNESVSGYKPARVLKSLYNDLQKL